MIFSFTGSSILPGPWCAYTDNIRLWNWKLWDNRHVTLEFTPADVEQIEKNFTEFADKRLPDLIQSVSDDLAHKILSDLTLRWPA